MPARETLVPVLLEKVYHLIATKIDDEQSPLVLKLAKHLFSNISHDDLLQRNESDLYGAIVSIWKHLSDTPNAQPSVKVFNPTVAHHGWKSTHTIVEIVMPDQPFLVDSIKMCLARLDITSHLMLHGPTVIQYEEGAITDIDKNSQGFKHSIFHIEVDKMNDKHSMQALEQELNEIIADTDLVVRDWQPMADRLQEVITEVETYTENVNIDNQHVAETVSFLRWLSDHNFTFMGYKEFRLLKESDETALTPTEENGLGLFSEPKRVRAVKLSEFSAAARSEARKPYLLILTKGNKPSRIHRPAYTDYIGIKIFDGKGKVIGEHRFTGLYTSAVYNQSVANIPLVKEKVSRILESSGYLVGSYSYKALNNILENYPRDELLQAKEKELLDTGMGVVQMQDRDLIRVFVRKDPFGRFLSCMVYVTKDRYNTELRKQTQKVLSRYFGTQKTVEFTTYFSESPLARTHYIVRVDDNSMDVDVKLIEQNLMEASSSWDDRLKESIVATYGENDGLALSKEYMHAFPRSYKEAMLPGSAIADIQKLEALSNDQRLGMLFYRLQEERSSSNAVRLKLYNLNEPLHLSDVMPMLENLGLRVIGESPYEIERGNGETSWILDFSMLHKFDTAIDLEQSRDRFQQAFAAIWNGQLENDGFNQLVLGADLNAREVTILRAYARYMRQVGFPFSQSYIEETLVNHTDIAHLLVELFHVRFDPNIGQRENKQQRIIKQIDTALNEVESLDDDRIIRRYCEMMLATVRTNYYQTLNGQPKASLSLKLLPAEIPEIPKPVPAFEIFVYSPDIEGVHLRGGKVARGGLRWSDRQEDFRTEVLGLVKAQQVKNTVIVPVGAKGGFVCKHQHKFKTRDEVFAEGQRCYKQFIRGLLDLSDNFVQGELTPPTNVVRHDEDDAYFVVAADKGTATFSDLANSVSEEYNFWLGDAFASGGSNGYDHKAMGITAKGAWESVKRHFRELGINCQTTDFTAMGVGDMAGDVFGNGMLLSKHIRLQAAFNHMHIFIDPNPDSASSWIERDRLFKLPRSSWEDYDQALISTGGGIFSRRAKSIPLSVEIQQMLGTDKTKASPNELIQMILKMEVDLLWNGGIGTYVKASTETDSEVGDRANDALRINGNELRAKVVGEGGNLGLTQLGRIEYALTGGRVNTDFVDNVGGVDSSDNEVNIKVLLNSVVAAGDMTMKQRNHLLEEMEEEVGQIVLEHAYCQSESISISDTLGASGVKEQLRFVHQLEKSGQLDRQLEYLPNDEDFAEREKSNIGLSRPELSVLVAYGKMGLKEQLACDEVAGDEYHAAQLTNYFPSKLRTEELQRNMLAHPLRAEIVATALANQIVNEMGCNFVARLQEETGAKVVDIANAYAAARHVFGMGHWIEKIRRLDNVISTEVQYELLFTIRRVLRRLAKWLLRNRSHKLSVVEIIEQYQGDVDKIVVNLDRFLVETEVNEHEQVAENWQQQGVTADIAHFVSRLSSLYSSFDISIVAKECGHSIEVAAKLYFTLGDRLSLHWFLNQINNKVVDNNWQALARAAFREDLDWQQRQLSSQVLRSQCIDNFDDVAQVIECWIESNSEPVARWMSTLDEFKVGSTHEFAKFSVAMRELMLLNLNCESKE
ncbi:NAD-glutamate dehydrogenase [Vibrio ulleungensis]|uniref:NAD-glutamate dehydrogenase n=1 Tax=Vibrio ulleungensis TaxID=2807619 RepID=A0ABS2HFB5_9VIBR|nr:NAD-glutamate dehydrogenase [Vibrio ulleungensis]MBM7035786.1 NAD-glutamate dehydrogenase [Vibrio ulleungensis]